MIYLAGDGTKQSDTTQQWYIWPVTEQSKVILHSSDIFGGWQNKAEWYYTAGIYLAGDRTKQSDTTQQWYIWPVTEQSKVMLHSSDIFGRWQNKAKWYYTAVIYLAGNRTKQSDTTTVFHRRQKEENSIIIATIHLVKISTFFHQRLCWYEHNVSEWIKC